MDMPMTVRFVDPNSKVSNVGGCQCKVAIRPSRGLDCGTELRKSI